MDKKNKVQIPELEEYIKEYKWKEENYPKNKNMKEYDKLELKFIRETWLEAYDREPTEKEIEEQKIELMKIKYLVESWANEYFKEVEKEHRMSLKKR